MFQASNPASASMNGPLAMVLLLAIALAFPISALLIARYRRSVAKSMRRKGDPRSPEPEIAARSEQTRPSSTSDEASDGPSDFAATELQAEVLRAPWRSAAVYVFAGGCFALVESLFFLIANELEFGPVRLLALFWVFAWPNVLTINLVAASTPRVKLATVVSYFIILGIVSIIAYLNSPEGSLFAVPMTWVLFDLPATLLLLTFLHRRVRAVGPLVLIFMIVAVLGVQMMLSVLLISDEIIRALVSLVSVIGLGAYSILFGLAFVGFFGGWPFGWLILWIIRRRYEGKRISDQSITIDTIWLVFAIANSLLLASKGTLWLLSSLLCFLVFKAAVWLGSQVLNATTSGNRAPRKLLVLRVFSRDSEKLFSGLAMHWRYIGSMQLIAGPDLARSTIGPHEFLDFVSGKLARRFIDGFPALEKRLGEMDPKADRDGRFRVNDFFCYDDTWKAVLSRLVENSNVVIMDLRGFTADNKGCLHEISELINAAPLDQVVFVIKSAADEALLRQQVDKSWPLMRPTSPNRLSASAKLNLFHFTGSRSNELPQLLGALCNAASSAK